MVRSGKNSGQLSTGQKIWDVVYPFVLMIILLILCNFIVLLVAGLATATYDTSKILENAPSAALWSTVLFYILFLILVRRNFKVDEMRFGCDQNHWPVWKNIAVTAAVVAAGEAVNLILTQSGIAKIFQGYSNAYSVTFEGQNIFLLILATCILSPVAEEVGFRGMIYRRARNYLGPVAAAFLAAAFFGIYHGNLIQFIYAFILGLILAFIYQKSGSLKLCIVSHSLLNLMTILVDQMGTI